MLYDFNVYNEKEEEELQEDDVNETVDLRFRDRIFTRDPLPLEAPQDASL